MCSKCVKLFSQEFLPSIYGNVSYGDPIAVFCLHRAGVGGPPISPPAEICDEMRWRLGLNRSFAPSGFAPFLRVYPGLRRGLHSFAARLGGFLTPRFLAGSSCDTGSQGAAIRAIGAYGMLDDCFDLVRELRALSRARSRANEFCAGERWEVVGRATRSLLCRGGCSFDLECRCAGRRLRPGRRFLDGRGILR
jgi:hypothetical protein